jgi:hypothetical protein
MPLLPKDEAGILKAQIYDLTEAGAKQALFGMVQILEQHPSILLVAFRLLIEDGKKYSNYLLKKPAGGA